MKQKINLALAVIAFVAVLATTICITVVSYNLFEQQVHSDLRINCEMICDTGIFQDLYAAADGEREKIDVSALDKLESDEYRITWIDNDGEVIFDNNADVSEMTNHLDRPEIQQALKQGYGEVVRNSDTKNMNTFYYALLLSDGTILRISVQARTIFSVFMAVAPLIAIIMAVIFFICFSIGHQLTGSIIRPIDMMAEHLDEPMDEPIYKELLPFANKIKSQHEGILAAVKSRQDFTANISHELKTPLTAITGYAELLENHMVGPDQEEHIAKQIRKSADRLLNLINDIIRLSELDHKEIPRPYVRTDLFELVRGCCDSLQVNAEMKHISLTCDGTKTFQTVDRDLIRELVMNLVQNAIQYNNEGGYVDVFVGTANRHPYIRVKDNGIGIAKDQQERVFERFYRVDKSRSRETGGTGLGLAIVKHIAEIHDAKISLDSDLGIGTAITISF